MSRSKSTIIIYIRVYIVFVCSHNLCGEQIDPENWKLIIFSDESLFPLDHTSGKQWIETGHQAPGRVVTQKNYSVMVWGAVWYNGRSTLSLTTGSINATRYIEVLKEHLLPTYPNARFKFIQDNA